MTAGDSPPRENAGVTYPVADRGGVLVWASDLAASGERPKDLSCLGCMGRLILRAGSVKVPHFAHARAMTCTNPETVLHRIAKMTIAGAITERRDRGERYIAAWTCPVCEERRQSNLASERVARAVVELRLERTQPDVTLLDDDCVPRVVIEVVVTHEPEPQALEWYHDNGVGVLIIHPSWDTIESLRSGFVATHAQDLRCSGIRHPIEQSSTTCHCGVDVRLVRVEPAIGPECWKCGRPIDVADIVEMSPGGERFHRASTQDLPGIEDRLDEMGFRVRRSYSQAEERWYPMHHCVECGAKNGDNVCYGETHTGTLRPGATVRVESVCAAGHWTTVREAVVPADAPPRLRQAIAAGGLARPTGASGTIGVDEVIRRMFGTRWP